MTTAVGRCDCFAIVVTHLPRWRLVGETTEVVLAPWGAARGRTPLSASDAERAIEVALGTSSMHSVSARALAECARFMAQRYGRVRPFVGGDARAVVREALARGLLHASTVALRYVPATTRDALDDAQSLIPLASDVLEQFYEKGIEVEDELVDGEPDRVELEASVDDPAFDYIHDMSACEAEPDSAIHDTAHIDDETASGAGDERAAGSEAAQSTDGGDGAIECGAEVEDDERHSIEDESESTEPNDADTGDALEPTDEPAAA